MECLNAPEIRASCIRMQTIIEFTVEKAVTRKDLLTLNFRYFFRTKMVRWFFLLCLVPCLVGITFNLLTSLFSAGALIPRHYIVLLLIIPLFLFMLMMLNVVFFTMRQVKVNESHFTNVTYRLDQQGFTRIHGNDEFYEPWSRFMDWSEDDRFFFVHMNDEQRSMHFIPKWGLKNEAEHEAVRQLLSNHVRKKE